MKVMALDRNLLEETGIRSRVELVLQPRTKLLRKFDVFFPMRATQQCHKIKTKSPLPSPCNVVLMSKLTQTILVLPKTTLEEGRGEYGYFFMNGCCFLQKYMKM